MAIRDGSFPQDIDYVDKTAERMSKKYGDYYLTSSDEDALCTTKIDN